MDQFLLFAGDNYYPSGGWRDFEGSFSDPDEAVAAAANLTCDWWHVVDSLTGEIVRTHLLS